MNQLIGHLIYIVGLIVAGLALPSVIWDPQAHEFILIIGFIAIWRYSWGLLNWVRYHIFVRLVFPQWRRTANNLGESAMPSHMYLLVTSFRIGTETTRKVYDSVIREAVHYGRPCTIVASIVERADEILIKALFEHIQPPEHVQLVLVRIAGTGKRDALAYGFRAISKLAPPEDGIVAVIDGDSMLPQGSLEKSAPFFKMMPKVGALTTDETCEVDGKWIFKEWYNMRFAQRHIYMSSVSLSKKVLTLTGRMSMFRSSIVCSAQFIQSVELDWIDHWRLGRFKFLTGDDKSSWYHILRDGYQMLYIPDVQVITIETPPDPSFIKSSIVLMRRWFGNMLRTNGRAIKLGPVKVGFFPWISIIDQRISMWTALTGPVVALLASFAITPFALLYYFYWMALTRYVLTLALFAARRNVSAFYPFLLYYNQIVGSIVKTTVLFRLDKQRWTRQNTSLEQTRTSIAERFARFSSSYMHAFSVALFVAVLASITHIITQPDFFFWIKLLKG
ncbi:MAG: glycosyltransferase [Rickettsiales bacterium]